MKKLVCLVLLIAMSITFLIPQIITAQYDEQLENAIIKAKTVFNITQEYDEFSPNIYTNDDQTFYDLTWSSSKGKLGSISATIDSNMNITRYYMYQPYNAPKQPRLPSISKSEGLAAAEAFINKVAPELVDKIKYQENNYPTNIGQRSYYYDFVRVEHDVPYYDNNISLRVNTITNEIESYYCNWNYDLVFSDTKNILSHTKAEVLFFDKLGLKLVYKLNRDKIPYLVYTYVYPNQYIDAKTGQVVYSGFNYNDSTSSNKEMVEDEAQADGGMRAELTPEELAAIKDSASIIPKDKAEEFARAALNIDNSFEQNYINLYKDWYNEGDYNWTISFYKEETQQDIIHRYSFYVSLDARTGEIKSFNKSLPYDKNVAVKYNYDNCLETAEDFIASMQSEKYAEVGMLDWSEPIIRPLSTTEPLQYTFEFTRKINGVYFPGDGFTVAVDTRTGEVLNYNFRWFKGEFPAANGVISTDRAHSILFKKVGIDLRFITRYTVETKSIIMPPMPENKSIPEVQLVYGLNQGQSANIDALSGELLDYSGKPLVKEEVIKYTDIENSPAKNKIEILAAYGIALPGKEFYPYKVITQQEFLYLLQKISNPYFDLKGIGDNLYPTLSEQDIIDETEIDSEGAVTRQDAAKYLVRSLNYRSVAEIKGIYILPFKDTDKIDDQHYGYAAIAYGLGFMKDNKGYFNPLDKLTREQAALILYDFLTLE